MSLVLPVPPLIPTDSSSLAEAFSRRQSLPEYELAMHRPRGCRRRLFVVRSITEPWGPRLAIGASCSRYHLRADILQ